jgi:AraC family transcriptional regulator of adaptative response/methylated-DNA-[protein]-cysteine methyltransferase
MNAPPEPPELSNHDSQTYALIARAIAFMRENHLAQPDLATIAEHVHLSEYHFQRLFKQWAGISPKRFAQYLTVEYAKSQITATKNLLELSEEVGLSSPGRLHDLFVNLEAMSPGEYKAGGAGLKIWYGVHQTPFGDCLIATTDRGICNLHFFNPVDSVSYLNAVDRKDPHSQSNSDKWLREEWQNAEILVDQERTREISDRLFNLSTNASNSSNANLQPLSLHVKGTNFQIQVWRALLNIPLGKITTYQDLAVAIDRPTAARAVGNAIAHNPIGYLIPCHRVIRASGQLGGYRWGMERKSVLLGWEASQVQASERLIANKLGINIKK